MKYIFLVLLILIILLAIPGLIISIAVARKKKCPYGKLKDYENEQHDLEYTKKVREWLNSIDYKYIKLKSPYNYDINAIEIADPKIDNWIVLLHGVTVNHIYMMDLAYFYNRIGFNVLAWDSRNHGDTGGKDITYGYYERFDLKTIVDYVKSKQTLEKGRDIKIGLHGISMGASILLAYAAFVIDNCDFYVADCPYSDLYRQISDVAQRSLKLPTFIMKPIMVFANFFSRIVFKFEIKKNNIMERIDKVFNPVLFINCKDDDYIDPAMTNELFEKSGSDYKDILLFDEGGHAGAYPLHRIEYEKKVTEFIEKVI